MSAKSENMPRFGLVWWYFSWVDENCRIERKEHQDKVPLTSHPFRGIGIIIVIKLTFAGRYTWIWGVQCGVRQKTWIRLTLIIFSSSFDSSLHCKVTLSPQSSSSILYSWVKINYTNSLQRTGVMSVPCTWRMGICKWKFFL